VNLLAFSHYLQALEYQRKANQVVGMLGGKTPHIQNLTVGGVSNAINLDSQATLGLERLESIRVLMDEVTSFVQQVYFVDACAIAAFYPDWLRIGGGVRNYMAVPDLPMDAAATTFDLPGGYILDGNLASVKPFQRAADQTFRDGVTEDVTHAYYEGRKPLHPWRGETVPQVTEWEGDKKYSWVKAPRFQGKPMQVGPLAQVLIGYAQGHPLTRKWTDKALDTVSAVSGRKATIHDIQSTMGRHLARAIRAAMLSELATRHWQFLMDNIARGDTAIHNNPLFPSGEIEGVGTHEAPRGTLSHWVVVDGGKIRNYQAVVPSTWNASPRDNAGTPGPYEASLLRNPIADPEKPLEVIRTIHSFDPCMACACHTFDSSGMPHATVRVL
jgi:hydrogenase large subunit